MRGCLFPFEPWRVFNLETTGHSALFPYFSPIKFNIQRSNQVFPKVFHLLNLAAKKTIRNVKSDHLVVSLVAARLPDILIGQFGTARPIKISSGLAAARDATR